MKNQLLETDSRPTQQHYLFGGISLLVMLVIFFMHSILSCSIIEGEDPTPTPTATPTETLTPTPTATPEPRIAPFISELWPEHYQAQELIVGDEYYVDSPAQITGMPSFLHYSQAIRTAVGDEDVTSFPYIRFVVDRPITLYIAYDTDNSDNLPNWLQNFSEVEREYVFIGTPVDRRFQLYEIDLPAGLVNLGANLAWQALGDPKTYLIFLVGLEGEYRYPEPHRRIYYDLLGDQREWYFQLPPQYEPDGTAPLLFYCQGAQGETDYLGKTVETTGLIDTCYDREVILIAPELYERYWGGQYDDYHTDLAFVNDLREYSSYYFPHHGQKIFSAGFSSGAFFSNVTALYPPRFCPAIVSFAGGIPYDATIWPEPDDTHFRVYLIVGAEDTDNIHEAVWIAYQAYSNAGYTVRFDTIPEWGHAWNEDYNNTMLDFLLDIQ